MNACSIHTKFFDDTCIDCKKEYAELKGLHRQKMNDYDIKKNNSNDVTSPDKRSRQLDKRYREFTEERAKKLYAELLLQFVTKTKCNEMEASEKARSILRKQCKLRHMPFWSWL